MAFNTKNTGGSNKEQAAEAIAYLRQDRNAQAFLLLSELKTEKDPAVQFALGLCHLRAGGMDEAIRCFEQALQLAKTIPANVASGGSPWMAENSEAFLNLTKQQIDDEIFLTPMDDVFFERFPKTAGQNVLMALVHAYRQKGMVEQARRLMAGLGGPAFEEYKSKMMEGQ